MRVQTDEDEAVKVTLSKAIMNRVFGGAQRSKLVAAI